MAQDFYYEQQQAMTPRPGVSYATTYYKQIPIERRMLSKHFEKTIAQVYLDLQRYDRTGFDHALHTPLKGFPRTGGKGNRSMWDLFSDIMDECHGQHRGEPKDFPLAPIERWNKLWDQFPDYQVNLIKGVRPSNNFGSLFND
jgi:hypothetical protein